MALGNILRQQNPKAALAVYDLSLQRIREIRNSVPARRNEAALLANSSYALVRLRRVAEAKRRIDKALAILEKIKVYPPERVKLDSDVYIASRARADYEAETGDPGHALELCQELLSKAGAADSDALEDLRDAPKLSSLYQALTDLYRRTGDSQKAEEMEHLRLDLWRHWDQKLPNNSFIRHQLEDASHS
jgi:tetratricopeptide (TPR) repeat protein